MQKSSVDPGHVVAQRYLEKRGFKYWEFMQQMGESVRVISHRQCLENCGMPTEWAKEAVYYLWFDYPGQHYGAGRCLNPTRRMGKMLCPKDVTPPLYIHPNLEPQEDVYFCESVLKAIKMVELGFCAYAGNGVDGINTNKGLAANFPDDAMENAKRAFVLFDSDITENMNVKLAGQKLALALTTRYPHLSILQKTLPPPPDLIKESHWGLDDYAAYHGGEDLADWVRGDDGESPFDLGQRGRHLLELAAQYAVSRSPVGIVCFRTGEVHKVNDFKTVLESNRKFSYQDPTTGNYRKACAATEYVEWRERNDVAECRYHPGGAPGFEGKMYNRWRDSGVEPTDSDVAPFLDMVMNAIPRNDEAWLMLKMWAWGLQNRGQRWEKILLLISAQQSTGKSTLSRILSKCYGQSNYASIDPESLGKDFNGLYAERELVLMDEVMKMKGGDYSKLERMTTDDYIDVNVKFGGQYMTKNYVNVILTSNDAGCIELKDAERRLFALEVTPTEYHPQGGAYWTEFNDWLDAGGYGAIRSWLEHLDLEDFDHRFMPPLNPMKQQISEAGRSDIVNWCLDLKRDPQEVMGSARMYFTPDELLACYLGGQQLSEGHMRGLKNTLTQALNKVGFRKANSGDGVTISIGGSKKKLRFWNVSGPLNHAGADVGEDYKTDPLYGVRFTSLNDSIGVQGTEGS